MALQSDSAQGYGGLDSSRLRWLYIDFDSFFASVEQHLNPRLRGQPVAVLPLMTDTTCAIAASYEAKAYGVKTGTPVWEAKRRCPMIRLVVAKHEHYVRIHKQIIAVIENHCMPIAAICSIDEIACQLTGPDQIPANALKLARHIKTQIAQHVGDAVRCSIGIASNRFLAKVAGDMQKPNGLTLLLPEGLPGALLKLKITDLPGIGHNMQIRLNASGIMTMDDLWALPPKQMRALWRSVEGERFWAQLHGHDIPAIITHRSTVGHSRVLEPDLRTPEKAHEVARKLVMKAGTRLRREGFAASQLGFGARRDDGVRFGDMRRFNHTQDTFLFLRMLDEMWKQMVARHKTGRVKKVSVTLLDLLPHDEVTGDLFAVPIKKVSVLKDNKTLSHALDRLHARYGTDAVTIGYKSKKMEQFGTKIAFTRVPDMEEFVE